VRSLLPRALVVVLAICLANVFSRADAESPAPEAPFVPGQVIVGLEPEATLETAGIASANEVRSTDSYVTVAVPEGREQHAIETLSRLPGVTSAELNYLAQPQLIPGDPRYPEQWDMPMIRAPEAWEKTRGAGIIVAVVDTGVAFEDYGDFRRDPELSHTTFTWPWDETKNDIHPNDDNGHGTHVTGTLAQDWDGVAVAGLVPDATIMPVKVCLPTGCPGDLMASGIRWAVDHGAQVINMSLGGPGIPSVERSAIQYAEERNVLIVAAAGNGSAFIGGPTLEYPAAVDSVIAVGAVDYAGKRTRYSNYGQHEHGGGVLIMAPGGDNHADLNADGNPDGVLQNTYDFACNGGPRDYTVFVDCYYQGTSMATPHVTGTIAMLLSVYPNLTTSGIREILACSAKDAGDPGPDDEYGAGIVQAARALSDNDQNGNPDCLDPRPELHLTIGGGFVRPTDFITLPVIATASQAMQDVSALVTSNASWLTPVACYPRAGATCSVNGNKALFYAPGGWPSGPTQLGQIVYESVSSPGQTSLLINGAANLPDEFDPPVKAKSTNGLVVIKAVPMTVTGDVNCDNRVNVIDVVTSLGFAVGVQPAFCWRYGDIDCSGLLESNDALAVLGYIGGLTDALPSGCPH
jgi:serine protease